MILVVSTKEFKHRHVVNGTHARQLASLAAELKSWNTTELGDDPTICICRILYGQGSSSVSKVAIAHDMVPIFESAMVASISTGSYGCRVSGVTSDPCRLGRMVHIILRLADWWTLGRTRNGSSTKFLTKSWYAMLAKRIVSNSTRMTINMRWPLRGLCSRMCRFGFTWRQIVKVTRSSRVSSRNPTQNTRTFVSPLWLEWQARTLESLCALVFRLSNSRLRRNNPLDEVFCIRLFRASLHIR